MSNKKKNKNHSQTPKNILTETLESADKMELLLLKEVYEESKKRNLKKQDSINQIPKQKSESSKTKQYTYEEQNKIFNEGLEAADKYEALLMKESLQEIKQLNLKKTNSDKEIIAALKLIAEESLLNLQNRNIEYLKNNKVKEDNFEKLNIVKELKHQIKEYDLKLSAISKKNNS